MILHPVHSYDEVVQGVQAFNQGLSATNDLKGQLSYFRSWYFIPELDAVGPSKFIGYPGMTASEYMRTDDLDGRVTEPALGRWFEALDNDSPEGIYVMQLVQKLLNSHNKSPNRKARFNAPRGWRLVQKANGNKAGSAEVNSRTSPLVDVFWQAFLSLSSDDRERFAQRIVDRRELEASMAIGYSDMSEENLREAEEALSLTREVVLSND